MFGTPAAIVPSPRWLNIEGETSTFRARRLQVAKRPGFGAPRPHSQQLKAEKRGAKPVPGRAGGAASDPARHRAQPRRTSPLLSSSSRAQESPSCFRTPQISPPQKKSPHLLPPRLGPAAGQPSYSPAAAPPARRARGEPRGGAEGTQPAAFTPFFARCTPGAVRGEPRSGGGGAAALPQPPAAPGGEWRWRWRRPRLAPPRLLLLLRGPRRRPPPRSAPILLG